MSKLVPGTLICAPWILYFSSESGFNFNGIESFPLLWYIIILTGFYITGIVWDFLIVKKLFSFLRLRPCMLVKAKENYYKDSGKEKPYEIVPENEVIIKEYKRAYYEGLKQGILRDLPIIESHENFLKTNWILVGIYALLAAIFLPNPWQVVVSLILFIFSILFIFIWYSTQMKIYYSVWEAADNIKNT